MQRICPPRYATTQQQVAKLARWKTKQLWNIVRNRSNLRVGTQHRTDSEKGASARPAAWRCGNLHLTPFQGAKAEDNPTVACRTTLLGRLSSEHRFLPQKAPRTQMREDTRQCIQSQEMNQVIDTTEGMNDEWAKWLRR